MEWCFIDNHTVKEKSSGYTLKLLSGSWEDPIEIQPEYPKGKHIRQALLLRQGLEFAHDKMLEAKAAKQA